MTNLPLKGAWFGLSPQFSHQSWPLVAAFAFLQLLAHGRLWLRSHFSQSFVIGRFWRRSLFRSLLSHGRLWRLSPFCSLPTSGRLWQLCFRSLIPCSSHGAKLNTRNTITFNPSTVLSTALSASHVPTAATRVTRNGNLDEPSAHDAMANLSKSSGRHPSGQKPIPTTADM